MFFPFFVWCCVGGCGKEKGYTRVGEAKERGEKIQEEKGVRMFGFGGKNLTLKKGGSYGINFVSGDISTVGGVQSLGDINCD